MRAVRVLRLQPGMGRRRRGAGVHPYPHPAVPRVMVRERLERVMVVLVRMLVMVVDPLGTRVRRRLRDDLRVYWLVHIGGMGERAQRRRAIVMVGVGMGLMVMHLVRRRVLEHVVMRLHVARGAGFKRVQQGRDIIGIRICT